MNNDQAVTVLNDVAFTYANEPDTTENREKLMKHFVEISEMGDMYVTTAVNSAIRKIGDGVAYKTVLNDLVALSEEMLDEIMGGS